MPVRTVDNRLRIFFSDYFDAEYYSTVNALTGSKKVRLFLHFLFFFIKMDTAPNCLFDPEWYRNQYGHQIEPKMNSFTHYIREGWIAGNDPHPLFSTSDYLLSNRDVFDSGMEPTLHYLKYGLFEDREISGWFRPSLALQGLDTPQSELMVLRLAFDQKRLGRISGDGSGLTPIDYIQPKPSLTIQRVDRLDEKTKNRNFIL